MGYAELIQQKLKNFPTEKQAEVYDFVEFIAARIPGPAPKNENASEWTDAEFSQMAVVKAMRGLEDDPVSYSVADLKERWQ